MYIDNFYFSPFQIKENEVSICNDEWIFKNGKIYKNKQEISADKFYDEFIVYGEGRWFIEDFILAFEDVKQSIPEAIAEFAVYCDFRLTYLKRK